MEIPRDAVLHDEAARFGLVMHCEDCALFDVDRERCAHGYPSEQHRKRASELLVVFCKDFEVA